MTDRGRTRPAWPQEYSNEQAAALYEVANPWGHGDDFYLPLVMDAASVLDVGCGPGMLLRRARELGHSGRLCGVDPDRAALDIARKRTDVEWLEGTAASMRWSGEFELAYSTGHAFQCFVADDDVRDSLAAIRRALVAGGLFAFETRNPRAREWDEWPHLVLDVVDPDGRRVRLSYDVESVDGDVVTFTESTSDANGRLLRVDRVSLRFLDVDPLDRYLSEAGFVVEARYGDWARAPLTGSSREIVTLARARD